MRKSIKIMAALSLIMTLCGLFSMGISPNSHSGNSKEVVRNWDPGESKPIVIL